MDETFFSSRHQAEAMAAHFQTEQPADVEPWRYEVEPYGEWFLVAVYDETGERMGAI